MKSVSQLRALVPDVTHDEISNYRRAGYIVGRRTPNGRTHEFFTRSALELRSAKPLIDEGLQLGRAFERAAQQYEDGATLIREFIADRLERRNGIGPTPNEVERALSGTLSDVPMYLEALIEESSLAVASSGQLALMSQFRPTSMLAYSSQPHSAFRVLTDDQRVRLRELAFDKYRAVTRNLPGLKLPAPLNFLEGEGFSVERRSLPLGKGGFSDPETKTIILASSIRRNSPQERFLLAHEYWHVVLGHSAGEESAADVARLEAEATYVAIHYLIPLHTFEIVVRRIEHRIASPKDRLLHLARTYAVSESIISQYRDEVAAFAAVDNRT